MSNRPFVPIGLPRLANEQDSVEQRVGLHLLEALESLDVLFKSSSYFAAVDDEHELAEFALGKCLEAVRSDTGVLFLVDETGLHLAAERNGGAGRIRTEELAAPATIARAVLWQAADSRQLLRGEPAQNALTAPIHIGETLAGMVIALAPADAPFSTADAKMIAAVASQAAIALGRSRHWRAIAVEREKLQLVVQNHPEGILVLDPQGQTTLCNPIAAELLGGEDALARLQRIDPSFAIEHLSAASTEREVELPTDKEPRLVAIRTRPVAAGDGVPHDIVVTIRDLTKARREERLKRNFVSLISHKLRTPLTALTCAIHLHDEVAAAEQVELRREMQQRVQDLGALVDRLFQFTELLEGSWNQRGSCDLRLLLRELAADWAASSRPPELQVDLAADAELVTLPQPRMRMMLHNLIDNAVKFSPGERPFVAVTSRRSGDRILVEVEDRGPGIPPSEHERILQAFHQVDTEFTGTVPGAGIGLAIVREIVNRIGGGLSLRQASPHGCVFSLSLPAPTVTAAAPSP
ncbi:MAG: PAS domain-containing sensor histidine kinase [Planctomycetes bacterium]|jgi:two-component system phosphate regulon sensor histidine kinase PhoR|nr:PAS domain-containing sensor histidine kinase [Planctomycetota bacterium]